jgi:putative oxidoreductase
VDIGLLIIRLVIGVTIAGHGSQKLFGWFGGRGLRGTGESFERMGYRPGGLFALFAGTSECGGGILLVGGLLFPLAAAAVIGMMLNAALSVHLKNGFWVANTGWEYTFVIGGVAAGLAFTGPGRYSLDRAAGWTLSGTAWGIAGVALALAVGSATALYRRRSLASAG